MLIQFIIIPNFLKSMIIGMNLMNSFGMKIDYKYKRLMIPLESNNRCISFDKDIQ